MTTKEKREDARLRRVYGVTLDWYKKQLAKQNNGCAICHRPPKKLKLAVDHNHISGKVRALLCMICNRKVLGTLERIKNYPIYPANIIKYLRIYDSTNKLLKGTNGPKTN